MFTTPRKVFSKFRAHPYLSPLKFFGLAETNNVTPSPGGHSIPPFSSRLSKVPTPRKRYSAYHGPSSLNPRLFRPVGKGYHRVGIRHSTSRKSLRLRRSYIRSLEKAKAARDSQFAGLSRAAFDAVNQARRPLTHEERIFSQQFANLGAARKITTCLAEARSAADRAVELAPLINAEREAKAQASLAREKEQQRVFATQWKAEVAAEWQRLDQAKRIHRKQRGQFVDYEELRRQAERERLVQEQEARHNEEVARLREERETFRRMEEERTRLENEQLAQKQRDAQAFIDASLHFQQAVNDQIQREQAARFQAEQEARAWFEAVQQAEMAANHAQEKSRGFQGIDVSMMDVSMRTEMDASMRIDVDVSMRTAAPYSPPPSPPPPPPPLTVADHFALYERKWAALKSDVPILSFDLLPWPAFHDVYGPEDITYGDMVEFFYHPERPGYEKKTQKERSRADLLRWHPDKILGKVLAKVDTAHRAMVEEAIGLVTRFLVASAASSS